MFMSGFGRRNVFKSIVLYLCVSALFILPISTLLTSLPAFAAGYFDSLSTQEKYKFYVYARALDTCFVRAGSKAPNSNVEELKKGKIFNNVGDGAYVGTFPGFTGYNNSGGYFDCNSAELMSTAVSQFNIQPQGRSSAVEVLLCKIGYRRGTNYTLSEDECINGSGAFGKKKKSAGGKDDRQDDVNIYSKGKIFEVLTNLSGYKNGIENSDPSIKYLVSRSMIRGCIKDDNPQPRRHNSKDWEIQDVDSNGNLTNSYYLPGDGQGYNAGGSNNREWPQNHYDAKISEWQCMNIYQRLVESAPKYQEALRQSATDTACVGLADEKLSACKDGVNHNGNKGNSAYCENRYNGDNENINACKQGQSAEIKTPSEGDGGGEEEKNSCGIDGMGWLICPLMTFMGGIADASYSVISQFLNIKPAIFDDRSDAVGAKQAWSFFRDIANVIFVLLFLWVIFSQVSSIGISNYGIKKVLPKLIVGAVLVNLSFYICQLAVDLSNILGFTLKEALEGAVSGVGGSSSNSAIVSGLGTAVAGILVLTGTVLFAALAVSIPTLLSLMLVLLVVLVILIVRQAAIVLLISIAPLAFAAWLLPNTESLFKKWVSMFRGLLMVFPIISLLYGAGKLAGAILMTTATSDPNDTAITMQFAGLAASILPLGATPFVIKSSLNSLGSIGAKIGGLSSVATGSLKNSVMNKSRISDAKNAWKSRSAKKLAERRSGNTKWGRTASNLRGSSSWLKKGVGVAMNPAAALDNSWVGQKIGLSSGAGAAQEAYDKSAMEKAERAITYQYSGDAEAALKDKKADKYTRIAAVNQLKGQGAHGADVVANYLRNGGEVDSVSMANALTEMKGSHAGVAQAGVNALNALQSGQSNFSLGAKDKSGKFIPGSADTPFNTLTSQGVSKLSNEAIAKQNADAIKRSSLSNSQASEILGDDRLVSIMSQDTRKALESI